MQKHVSALLFLIAICAGNTWAGGLKSLEVFVQTVRTGRADFTQVVTSPGKDGGPPRVKKSSGTFEFARPNRFRFNYQEPFVQQIVADGNTLWLYDEDLNQVTARKQASVMAGTPAALVSAAPDLKALQDEFELEDAPDQDGMQWAQARPKKADGQLQRVRIGFRAEGGDAARLEVLDILDSFGQHSVMTFSHFQTPVQAAAGTFVFKPPAGVDVIRP
jgi:outer membrane lipoprotein carrier protein